MSKTLITLNNYERIVYSKSRFYPWSKLYNSLLDSAEWRLLNGEQAKLLVGLHRLALKTDNKIPNDHAFLKRECGLHEEPDVEALIPGFIKLRPLDRVSDGPKKSYGEGGNAKLTEREFKRLCEKYGEKTRDEYIERLDLYANTNAKKFNRYTRHYSVIQTWISKDKKASGDDSDISGEDEKKAVEAAKQAFLNE